MPQRKWFETVRWSAAASLVLILAAGALACGGGDRTYPQSMVVLGIDGMDYSLTQQLMTEGKLPNLSRLAQQGTFQSLGTSFPPQSPVAWSNFITGLDSGGHGIYDFVHRDPETMAPYLSTSKEPEPGRTLNIGKWSIPLSAGEMQLLRHGTPFWEVLEEHGVPSTIIRMPANFPPSGTAYRELSGMGTPDILGTPGFYSFYTTQPERITSDTEAFIERVRVRNNVVEAVLHGPPNPLLAEPEDLEAPFTVYLDADNLVAEIVIGSESVILQQGEWSDWVPVSFDLIPYVQSVSAQARFFLKEVRPEFELYVSPVNLDALAPVMPISTPEAYAVELAEASGRFYTQGMPEDTNALQEGVFNSADFMAQAAICPRRDPPPARLHARPVRGRLPVLLLRRPGPGIAHDVARHGPRSSGARSGGRCAVRQRRDRPLPRSRRDGRRGHAALAGGNHVGGDVGPRIHLVAARLQPQHLVAGQRLHHADEPAPAQRHPVFRQRRLGAHAGLRAGAQRPLHQPAWPRANGIVAPEDRDRLIDEISNGLLRFSIRRPASRRSRRCTRATRYSTTTATSRSAPI